ncbi:MAG: DUF1549 domain-containing protein, partial [Pedosphaera sp.]|nr:DUF1549 domain-containing protein [Pedosphaera sp.]
MTFWRTIICILAFSAFALKGREGEHWAFLKPERHEPPKVKQVDWPRNAIDHFILAELENKTLTPSHQAYKTTLLRRVHLDLIGLPPSPAEVDAFLVDKRSDAYERAVDKLLVSPHYGERWGRHWLDVARFAESHGFEQDYNRPHAYHYRD